VLAGSIDDVGAAAGDVGAGFGAASGIHDTHGFCRTNQSGGNRSLIAIVSLIDEIL
jgi:hypothetical protein